MENSFSLFQHVQINAFQFRTNFLSVIIVWISSLSIGMIFGIFGPFKISHDYFNIDDISDYGIDFRVMQNIYLLAAAIGEFLPLSFKNVGRHIALVCIIAIHIVFLTVYIIFCSSQMISVLIRFMEGLIMGIFSSFCPILLAEIEYENNNILSSTHLLFYPLGLLISQLSGEYSIYFMIAFAVLQILLLIIFEFDTNRDYFEKFSFDEPFYVSIDRIVMISIVLIPSIVSGVYSYQTYVSQYNSYEESYKCILSLVLTTPLFLIFSNVEILGFFMIMVSFMLCAYSSYSIYANNINEYTFILNFIGQGLGKQSALWREVYDDSAFEDQTNNFFMLVAGSMRWLSAFFVIVGFPNEFDPFSKVVINPTGSMLFLAMDIIGCVALLYPIYKTLL